MSLGLPLEGLTLEYLTIPIRRILLQPAITAALLLVSIRKPQDTSRILSVLFNNRVSLSLFSRASKVLLAAGILYRVNNLLTRTVLNNWVKDESWDWKQEIVIVTGGCGGIGDLITRKLAERNIKVVIFDVVEPRTSLPPSVTFYKVDITSSDSISETAEKVRKEVGEPSVLVNCAGVGCSKEILKESEKEIRLAFNVNIIAHFLLVKEFLPHMVKQNHGHVVTIASMASFMVHAGNVDYCCTKAGTLAFHEGLSQELKARYNAPKVRTTIVHPTWVRTPLIDRLSRKKDFNEFVLEPQTVANAVVAQILKGESAQLVLPGRYGIAIPSLRGSPSWFQEGLRNSVAQLLRHE